MSKAEKAKALFMEGANCAQAVCGAVSGMVLVLNMLYGTGNTGDKNAKDSHYARIQSVANAFKAECGSIVCRELLGLDKKAPTPAESEARTPEYYKKRPCADMVALAAEILEKYLEENPG